MKKERLIIHIGMHKTGSSSIQRSLDTQRVGNNYKYCKLRAFNHSVEIYTLFSKALHPIHIKQGINTRKELLHINHKTEKLLIGNILNYNRENLIISGEDVSSMNMDSLNRMRDFFDRYFKEILIVAYIRSPKSYIESAFQQLVRGGMGSFNLENSYPNYKDRFEKFDLIFGKESVKLWKFEHKAFKNQDVVEDFCYRLNIDINKKNIYRINESISQEALSILYLLRKYSNESIRDIKKFHIDLKKVEILSKIEGKKLKFSNALLKPILDKNKDDIKWIESRLQEPLRDDIKEDSKDSIGSEDDLLKIDEESIYKLYKIVGYDKKPKLDLNNKEELANHLNTILNEMASIELENQRQMRMAQKLKGKK